MMYKFKNLWTLTFPIFASQNIYKCTSFRNNTNKSKHMRFRVATILKNVGNDT